LCRVARATGTSNTRFWVCSTRPHRSRVTRASGLRHPRWWLTSDWRITAHTPRNNLRLQSLLLTLQQHCHLRACGSQISLFIRAERKMRDPARLPRRAEKPRPPRRYRACRQNRGTRARGKGLKRFHSVIAAIDALTTSRPPRFLRPPRRSVGLWN
jgi:hypothetical protein